MKPLLYKKLLNSIDRELKNVIIEQFNANDLDFSDDADYNITIFNKATVDPYRIYKIMTDTKIDIKQMKIEDWEIQQLNDLVSVVKVKNTYKELLSIVMTYIYKYPTDSMNWLDVSDVTHMSYLFDVSYSNVENVYNGDISKWDVSNVKNMSRMFGNTIFNGDISQWNVSNVENMSEMFINSKFNGDISEWNVSNVENMSQMFYNSVFNRDISKWDVSNVKYMSYMFEKSNFNQDISKWDVSNVIHMYNMFYKSKFNKDISGWDVSNVENMENMFAYSSFTHDISNWDMYHVKKFDNMFKKCPLEDEFITVKCACIKRNKPNYNQDEEDI